MKPPIKDKLGLRFCPFKRLSAILEVIGIQKQAFKTMNLDGGEFYCVLYSECLLSKVNSTIQLTSISFIPVWYQVVDECYSSLIEFVVMTQQNI